jgi:predicted DsbA family dithiol-disulfide isomerase
MKIEIWYDFLCPQSYLLQVELEKALSHYHIDDLEIWYRSYEMMPKLKNEDESSLFDVISKHLLVEKEEVIQFFKQFPLLCDIKPYAVHDAHRLTHLAKQHGVAFEFISKLMHDYYEHHQNISDHDYLRQTSLSLNIPETRVDYVLSSDQYSEQVNSNRENAIIKGIHRIPHLRINGQQPMYGYQTEEQLIRAFKHAGSKLRKQEICEDESCEIQ